MPIRVKLDHLLLDRRITLTELADRIGITIANLSVLKTNKAKAMRFSTLEALCRELDCQPGDLLEWTREDLPKMKPMSAGARSSSSSASRYLPSRRFAALPMLALFDAQTPIDALFWTPASAVVPCIADVALPAAPVVDIQSPRAPPLT